SGGFVRGAKALVVGQGTSNGVEVGRFAVTAERRAAGAQLLEALGVGLNDPLIGCVGRLSADKGIADLIDAFALVRAEVPSAKLVLIGGDLADDALAPALRARVQSAPGLVLAGRAFDLSPYYARMNVLAFP